MTWDEIRKIHTWLPELSDGWHQHAKGGGWARDSATVADCAYVGERAIVDRGTIKGGTIKGGTIKGGTIWGGTIWGGTIWGGTIKGGTIKGGTIWGGTIWGGTIKGGTIWGGTIWDGTIWGGTIWDGTIKGGTIWGGTIKGGTIKGGTIKGGTIKGGTISRTPILIFGSRYWIGFSRPGHIASGCIERPITWWLENVERCAEENGYTAEEQREYRLHVEHIAAWMDLYGLNAVETNAEAESEP
jgi:hypothetical protein